MYYIYEYYIEETGEIFYVGKGSGYRFTRLDRRSQGFMKIYNHNKCNVRKIYENIVSEDEAYRLEKERIFELKKLNQAKCNKIIGRGFESGMGNPMYGIRMTDEENPFYGRKHSKETKEKISESRKGKGGQSGRDNPMYGKGFRGEDNPMYGKKRLDSANHKVFKMLYTDGSDEILISTECINKFGIAFIRVRETGGALHYKKSTPASVYEGTIVELL